MTKLRKTSLPDLTQLEELIGVAAKGGRVNLRVSVHDEDWVAIEGDKASLEFLGNLLLMSAKADGVDCLNLDSPECPVFKTGSQGLILYRNP